MASWKVSGIEPQGMESRWGVRVLEVVVRGRRSAGPQQWERAVYLVAGGSSAVRVRRIRGWKGDPPSGAAMEMRRVGSATSAGEHDEEWDSMHVSRYLAALEKEEREWWGDHSGAADGMAGKMEKGHGTAAGRSRCLEEKTAIKKKKKKKLNVPYKRAAHISELRIPHHNASSLHLTSNFSTTQYIFYFKGSEDNLGP